jgi:hypothetical protein
MSQTAITLAFEQWKAQQAATGEPILLDEFVFALVPGLDPDLPVDRSETLPPSGQIVYRESVTRRGVVNENAVVHSTVLGADVGDFSFNWVGLLNKASGTLAMIVHAPEQQKLKTKEGQQGNVLTRSFLMEFTGAQAETAINTPAETWQIDFTARLAGMDERQRLENTDIFGLAAFFGDSLLVNRRGDQYYVNGGAGYVGGLRVTLTANQDIAVTPPSVVWVDACWRGTLTSVWTVDSKITVAASLDNYVDDSGTRHYVAALARINADGSVTDLRPRGTMDQQYANATFLRRDANGADIPDVEKFRSSLELGTAATATVTTSIRDTTPGRVLRVQDYGIGCRAGLNTRNIDFNTYDFIQGEHLFINTDTAKNLPAGLIKSGHYFAFVHGLRDTSASPGLTLINYLEPGEIWTAYGNGPAGNRTWILCRTYNTRFKPSAADTGALPANGNAVSATKLQTARLIGGVSFNGTANINLPGVNTQGNQNTTGNAATATRLQTARTINGVAFNGTANITITAGQIGAYTKAESDKRYVQDIDHTAPVEKQFYDGQPYTNTHATDGAYLANIRFVGGMSNVGWFIIRYTRKKINGTWYTLS